jgi:hypothetical protein
MAHGVHHVRGLECEQTGLLDHAAGLGNAFLPHGLASHFAAKSHAFVQAFAHQL